MIIYFTFAPCLYMERKYGIQATLKGSVQCALIQCAPTQWQALYLENASLFIVIKISDALI